MRQLLKAASLCAIFIILGACSAGDDDAPTGTGHGVYILIDTQVPTPRSLKRPST